MGRQGDKETRRQGERLASRRWSPVSGLVLPVSCLLLLASCFPAPTFVPTRTPTSAPIPTPSPTLSPSPPPPTPTPTPTPTPVPTLSPAAVTDVVAAGEERWKAAGAEPVCLRWEDLDNDGKPEWAGLYLRPGGGQTPPGTGAESGGGQTPLAETQPATPQAVEPQPAAQLVGFVLDGETWHDLRPLEKEQYGLGQYPTCELEVRDVNADGKVEILVWGHADVSTDLLHIFAWDGATYAMLAAFEGKSGVRLENADGDLADEVVVGYEAGKDLVWEAVYTWDGASYGWTWERYAWFYLDRPHAYQTDTPEHAVISFYLAVDDRDLPGAYNLLSPSTRAVQPAEEWMVGFVTTLGAEVGAVHELARSGDVASVIAQVRAYDSVDGRVVATMWDVQWTVVQTPDGWRLESATTTQLEQWEASYYR